MYPGKAEKAHSAATPIFYCGTQYMKPVLPPPPHPHPHPPHPLKIRN